jgi:Tol biopolymer transport system component/DNA-binding winged helix-turn-helix (wHTH) protein
VDQPTIFRFGAFEVDVRTGELRKNGAKINLQQQPFQILVALISRPGELVTRGELRRQLWPEDTFVDFNHSLNAAIKRLRDSLGESADAFVYIETLPRRGYRFLAPVQRSGGQLLETATREASISVRPSIFRSVLVAVLLLGALITTAVYLSRHSVLSSAPPMKVVPFTAELGAQFDPSFSPDGRQVAFIKWNGRATDADVYTKLVGGNDVLRLTSDPGWACCTTWSPDGLYVAYERCGGPHVGLNLVPALGGPERTLAGAFCLGDRIAVTRKESDDSPYAIYFLNTKDLRLQRITSPQLTDIGDRLPAFSPDGKTLAFIRATSPWVTDLFVIAASGGEARRLTFDNTQISDMAWTADGKDLVMSSHRAGGMRLWKVPAAGGAPEPLPVGGADSWRVSISRQGDKLAYTVGGIHPSIWQMDLDAQRKGLSPKPLLESTKGDAGPQFSPDGRKLTFASGRSGSSEIWICDADGSNLVQLTVMGVLSGTPRWSPDGEHIAFDARPNGHSHIFVISVRGGQPRPITTGEYENSVPSWSRDGKWIYFTSNRTSPWQIWKVSAEGGEPIQITKHTGYAGFESVGGREFYYVKINARGIWKQPIDGGEETQVVDASLGWGHWAVARNGIYFVDSTISGAVIKFYDFLHHQITEIATPATPLYQEDPGFDVSPDERRIIYNQLVSNKNIVLVENFR